MLTANDYMQLNGTFNTIKKAVDYIPNLPVKSYVPTVKQLLPDLCEAVKEINLELLDSPKVSFCDMDYLEGKIADYAYKKELVKQYKMWHRTMLEVLERQYKAKNRWDEKFVKLMDYIRFVDFDSIVEKAKDSLFKQDDIMKKKLCSYYQGLRDMWGHWILMAVNMKS